MLNRGPANLVELRAYDPSTGCTTYDEDAFATELHAVLRPSASEFRILASVLISIMTKSPSQRSLRASPCISSLRGPLLLTLCHGAC
jgi:hypothetical protein